MANRLSLLLDGLDEVAVEQREVCVTAINAFKADHPGDIVVCSRLSDYEKLGERLNLSAAIRIQPLDPTQIDDYLASFGPALTNLRQAVAADDEWRELAQSPLMLNLMAFTYREANALPTGMTLVEKRRQLLTAYIQRTWQRRPLPPNNSYNKPNALFWLHNLAAGLQANNQSIFYIEQLQPSWLPNPLPYRWLVGIIFGLVFGLIFGLLFGVDIGLLFGLGVGLNGVREKPVRLIEEIQWQRFSLSLIWEKGKEAVVFGILLGVLFGQLFVPLVEPSIRLLIGLSVGLSVGMFVGLRSFTQIGETRQRTQPNQGIWTSWRNARWIGFIYGGLYGLSLGLLFGLSLGFINGLISGLISRLSVEMISGLRDELISGLISGLSVGLVNGLISGLSVGLVNGMRQYGGETVVRHYVLRWLLARQRVLPFPFQDRELIAYLDAMAERLLLRRVGGGWMFIHRTLLDYFAENRELGKGDVMGDE
jgi:hypothetical protein